MMKRCSLCGSKLNFEKRCTFCGLDNTKNDEQYKHMINKNDCENSPLTHVHEEQVKKFKKPMDAKKVISIIVIIVMIISTVSQLVADMDEESTAGGIYAYVNYDLPEYGMEYQVTLEPGIYTVGVHIPEGTYKASVVSGDYGMIEIHDFHNSIYLSEFFGLEEEYTELEDLRLYQDGHFVVSTGLVVELFSENVQSLELFSIENPNAGEIEFSGSWTAGIEFPAGVYDIRYVPQSDSESGYVCYSVPEESFEAEIGFSSDVGTEIYHNVVLPEGAQISLKDLTYITLIPSETVSPGYKEFYETYY